LLRLFALAAALAVSTLVVAGAGAVRPTYKAEALADDPAGYWRLGELTGTKAADETANDNKGTYLQGVTKGIVGALATDSNTAARFDGGSGRVSMGDPASGIFDFDTEDFSVEAWIKTSENNERSVIGKRGTTYWQVTVTDDGSQIGRLRANVFDGAVSRQAYSLVRVDNGAWHHIAVVFDRDSGIRFYTDGAAAGFVPGAMAGSLSNAAELVVGKISGYSNFKGDIDEVAVYRGLLSAERVQAHYYAALNDTTAPNVTLTAPAAGSSSTDPTPAFDGTAGTALGDTATVAVKVYDGPDTTGTLVQTVTATRGAGGAYSAEATEALAAGSYTAQAEQLDVAENVGTSAATAFTVEAGEPPPPPPPPPAVDPVLLGAGDIASCGVSSRDEATADILDDFPDATVFTLGDNAYDTGTAQQFADCYEPSWGRVKARTHPTPGGHDYLTPGAAGYYGYFGAAAGDPTKGYYSYDLGAWHVVVLNSDCTQVGGCSAGSAQENWLRNDLATHPADCTVAYWHEPRFSSGSVHGNHEGMQDFWQALYDYGVDVVLGGDDHLYERFLPQKPDGTLDLSYGITQFVVGTGGYGVLYDFGAIQPNSAARIPYTHGVLKLALHANSYDWEFVPIAGQTATESGTASCHAPSAPPPPAPPPLPPPPPPGPPPPSAYREAVLSDEPRAYWRLAESIGTTAAEELGAAPGTYLGGVTLRASGALEDEADTAAAFDGGDDRISVGDPASGSLDFGTGDFSVEAWVKATANDERAIVSKRPYGTSVPYWQVTVSDDGSQTGRIRVNLSDGTASIQAYGPAVRVDDGTWHHVVVVVDRDSGVTIHVDGNALTTAGTVPGDLSNAGELQIGKSPGYAHYKGVLDEVAVYAVALDAARVQAHLALGRGQ
jgi:hypothetical protein